MAVQLFGKNAVYIGENSGNLVGILAEGGCNHVSLGMNPLPLFVSGID